MIDKTQSEHNRSVFGIGLFLGSSRPKLPVAEDIEPDCRTVIQAPDLWGRIMRYEITDEEWTAIKRVERLFNKIKHCRCVATRYDKLAANYLAFIQLASIRLWLRV